MGCKAHIIQRQYILYPEYAISSGYESKRQERSAKEETLKQLRLCIENEKPVKTKSVYYVSLPTEEAHHPSHPTRGANIMAQRVNPNIATKISELVGEGMTDPYEVSKALKHVTTVLRATTSTPDPDDRAYYPTIRDLRNHIYKAKKALELSKLDQQNLKLKIEEWAKSQPETMFHFRPFIKSEKCKEEDVGKLEQEFEQSLEVAERNTCKVWQHNDLDRRYV